MQSVGKKLVKMRLSVGDTDPVWYHTTSNKCFNLYYVIISVTMAVFISNVMRLRVMTHVKFDTVVNSAIERFWALKLWELLCGCNDENLHGKSYFCRTFSVAFLLDGKHGSLKQQYHKLYKVIVFSKVQRWYNYKHISLSSHVNIYRTQNTILSGFMLFFPLACSYIAHQPFFVRDLLGCPPPTSLLVPVNVRDMSYILCKHMDICLIN